MNIIYKYPNESGKHDVIQSWDKSWDFPTDHAIWPDELDTTDFYSYEAFVTLTIENVNGVDIVTDYVPNVEAYEEWKANRPEPEPIPEPEEPVETATYDEMAAAIAEGVNAV